MAPLIQKSVYVQPLLVTFSNAKTSLYINRNLTKAEAEAEYEYHQRCHAKARASLDPTSRPLSAIVILPPSLNDPPDSGSAPSSPSSSSSSSLHSSPPSSTSRCHRVTIIPHHPLASRFVMSAHPQMQLRSDTPHCLANTFQLSAYD